MDTQEARSQAIDAFVKMELERVKDFELEGILRDQQGPTRVTYTCPCGHSVSGSFSRRLVVSFFEHTESCSTSSNNGDAAQR